MRWQKDSNTSSYAEITQLATRSGLKLRPEPHMEKDFARLIEGLERLRGQD